jgi:hypothetical protein
VGVTNLFRNDYGVFQLRDDVAVLHVFVELGAPELGDRCSFGAIKELDKRVRHMTTSTQSRGLNIAAAAASRI